MKTYRALKNFPHANSYVSSGALVRLTDKQATYLMAGGYVEESAAVSDAPVLPSDVPADTATKPTTSKDTK